MSYPKDSKKDFEKEKALKKKAWDSTLSKELESCKNSEEKLRFLLDSMKETLSQKETPQFKEFWEMRKQALPLFKEKGPSFIRHQLWKEFIDLTGEAKRLREVIEEQTSFAVEQIEIALEALQQELEKKDSLKEKLHSLTFPEKLPIGNRGSYEIYQNEIQLLSAFASRLQSLRKEILHTDMRMRKKNILFKKVSLLGDQIFPKRKQLMETFSTLFFEEVQSFIKEHRKEGHIQTKIPYYLLLEEIKAFQAFAKEITLTPEGFLKSREALSEFWEQVKELEKQRKKEIHEKRQSQKQIGEDIQEKIALFAKACQEKTLSLAELEQQKQEIEKEMAPLSKKEKWSCQTKLREALQPIYESVEKKTKEKEEKKQQKIHDLKETLTSLLESASISEEKYEEMKQAVESTSLTEWDRFHAEYLLAHLKEKILEQSSANLPELQERLEACKMRLEQCRKVLASSNLDFFRAFFLKEMIDKEKALMDKLLSWIEKKEES